MSRSIVQYYGEQTSKCGYCTGTSCSKSQSMHAYSLVCDDYQELIDRGWRRCGNYCYKPQNGITCCPCYTIKCDALDFKLTKSNKRILRRMNKFLRDGKCDPKEHQQRQSVGDLKTGDDVGDGVYANELQPELPDKKPAIINVAEVETLAEAHKTQMNISSPLPAPNVTATIGDQSESILASNKSKSVSSNTNPPRKKAKQMRLERKQAKLGIPLEQPSTKPFVQEKSLQDFLAEPNKTDKHQLKLRLVPVNGEEFTRTLPQSYELYKKYQITIHNDPPKNRKAYKEHLQQTPMQHRKPEDGPDMGYGSFHQQYWLDDKLIAVGVIDILPGSISSVYFFYDPDFSFLSLGTYGSLREIHLVQTLAERVPSLKYYYMGFYIHSCPKMRYKGKLSASFLLCPETYVWLPLTDAIRSKLDGQKYQRLHPDTTAKDENEFLIQHLNDVQLLLNAQTFTTYKRCVQLTGTVSDRDVIIEYGKLVGRVCAQRMLYVYMS